MRGEKPHGKWAKNTCITKAHPPSQIGHWKRGHHLNKESAKPTSFAPSWRWEIIADVFCGACGMKNRSLPNVFFSLEESLRSLNSQASLEDGRILPCFPHSGNYLESLHFQKIPLSDPRQTPRGFMRSISAFWRGFFLKDKGAKSKMRWWMPPADKISMNPEDRR